MSDTLLDVHHLKKYFPVRRGILQRVANHVKAVDDISFSINRGETLSLVGESGCGKTTAGRALLNLIPSTSGTVRFDGIEITGASTSEMRPLRQKMQIVFQDPYSSLNPRMTVKAIVEEGLTIHGIGNRQQRTERVGEILHRVGLDPSYVHRYPHEFSGGQRQRLGIARALAVHPTFVVLDEPISALDVSIQSQIINLLNDLKRTMQLTYLFISHDLSVVRYLSDRVAVMYLGEIVELASSQMLYENPLHPYTKALLSAVPRSKPQQVSTRVKLPGDVPSPLNPPSGCRFHPRCPLAEEICRRQAPEAKVVDQHLVACHLVTRAE
ncbi:MAG: dipeptide ABC transporter ATP-binding protein [Planctomycetota bacterium]|nr:dipeptide ABC transporter ATP-binding protein [Planctomycetota bacterium]